MFIKIKRIDNTLPLPDYQTSGACGFDLYSRIDCQIMPGEISLVPSNFIIETPPEHVLIIAPRSSLARKKGLVMPNSIGIIDQDFAGEDDEIMIQLQNITKNAVSVEKGERLAQGIFTKFSRVKWHEVDEITSTSRGGFGTTGGYQSSQSVIQSKKA